ncbi:MAG: hypothetical protein J5940_03985, partial [Clostridia bacterium]|nr:hypothetical protein [Clostridia bacterium]
IGDLVGNNAIETPIKWVGVSVENTGAYNSTTGKNDYCGKHVGYYNDDNDHYGTDPTKDSDYTAPYKRYGPGYVVFANYNASDSGTTLANIDDSTTPADDCTNVPAAYPYNTVNPTLDIGGVMLTGDGVAANKDVLAIKNILLDGVAGRYKYAASALYETGVTNYAAFNANAGKLVMFRSEVPTYLGTDFPVLIVDSTDHATTHKLINSYLRLLTNTTHDFGRDSAGEYEVEIYNMSFDNGVFVPSATGASLKRKDNQFYMSATTFDSGKTQFSLIDVRFFDPANPTQVAYHLYVPVFVKKVMTYQFDIAVLSGTDYLKSTYTSHFGDPLIENTGTPVTFFFRYTYSKTNEDSSSSPVRTTTEWQDAINAGENVNRNYEKKLQFYKANTNDVLNDMPGDTILVLVDPNRGGKPYYAKLSDALSGNTINLSAFKETMTKSGDTVTFSGDSFAPVNLDQMMNISLAMNGDDPITYVGAARDGENHLYRLATAEEIADGNITKYTISGTVASAYTSGDHYVECDSALVECADNDATVMVGSQGYRPVTDAEILNSGITKYSVVVTDSPLVEQYYLSVFTESNAVNDEVFHYYLVQSPSAFDETEYPSRISDTGAHTMVHLVMGKIFYHGNFSISSTSGDGALIMSDTNTTLTVTMNATMGLNKSLGEAIFENMQALVDATNVYQGFLLYLNREESPNSYKAILGSPTGSGTYQIDSGVATDYAGNIDVNQNFAKFTTGDLSSNFAAGNFETGNNFTISAEVTLTYSAGAIPTQFPSKANNENNGTWVSGASNIAFSTDAVANSKNRIGGDEGVSKKLYYSEGEPDVASLDLNPVGDRVGDFTPLGINARNNDGQQSATIDLLAVLDVTSIQDQIRDNPSTPSDDESYTNAVVTVTLLQKQNDASYTGIDDISQYITGLELVDSSIIVTDAGASYTATIPKTNPKLFDNGAEITLPVLRFTIKTGSAFESGDLTYGNYRINVSVRLQKSDEPITNSEATNYVIYSNVKVIPYYID